MDQWKEKLTPEQYRICRLKGTERAFTGEYWETKTPGTYHCVACDQPLFLSETKYDSGTGWPSFFEPIEGAVAYTTDHDLGYERTEVHCSSCESHLGHVFDDGPPPSGKRFCLNSAALRLITSSEC